MKYATLRLSKINDHKKYFDLNFKLIDNHFAGKWVDRVLAAKQKQYPISEQWAMYNINNDMDSRFVIKNLNRLISDVDAVEPLFGFYLDNLKDQDKLNKIHSIFEKHHGKLDDWKHNTLFEGKPESFRKNLSEINQFVHACESASGSPKIRIVWFDLPKTHSFMGKDYQLFTHKRTFGSLYHLYCDVGKNIEDLATDKDEHHHDVVPNIHYSADCTVYFCDDNEDDVKKLETQCNDYIETHKQYLADKGDKIGEKRLTTGRIELAKLDTTLSKDEVMEKIKHFNHIQDFFLT